MFLLLISVSYPSHPDFWRNNNIFKNRLRVYSSFCLEIKSVVHLMLKGLVILSLKSPARNIEFVNDLPCRKVVQWKVLVAWAESDAQALCPLYKFYFHCVLSLCPFPSVKLLWKSR